MLQKRSQDNETKTLYESLSNTCTFPCTEWNKVSIHFCIRLNHPSKHFVQSEDGSSKTYVLKASTASSGDENRCPRSLSLITGSKKSLAIYTDRFNTGASHQWEDEEDYQLTSTLRSKLDHFFTCLLDSDKDNLVSDQDFASFSERLREFAIWSTNSTEFKMLQQIEIGFTETFFENITDTGLGFMVNNQMFLTRKGWIDKWTHLLSTSRTITNFPNWLQNLGKILFEGINKSGSGIISRNELGAFYSSILGFDSIRISKMLDVAYQIMTSNGDRPLDYNTYHFCYANYFLGRCPNGPGQFLFGLLPSP
ncbi:hypothetical protein RI129_012069 [Pyrocoelia pectoralis]|uniref:EF-hand domain-containing protein n=1 Tax=Pyrocoelia pectoralis TaxID=417401 RepID=A0AAN7ZE87_9COLE